MATKAKSTIQQYPRIEDLSGKQNGLLDDSKLAQHIARMPVNELPNAILLAIENANKKSSRVMLSISEDATTEQKNRLLTTAGKDLFKYFKQYSSDPASTAYQLQGKSCREVGKQQFHNKALQKERMNSGWRYQYLAIDCARATQRFLSVSDLGLKEADFSAAVFIPATKRRLGIYVSVKNRGTTIGGPDWPNAIQALEAFAISDKNRPDYYICVFAFVMESGGRTIKRTKDNIIRSQNTELWYSDFFWPFFANYSYEEIMKAVLSVLMSNPDAEKVSLEVPNKVIDVFEECCSEEGLIDSGGYFNDPFKLVEFFCSRLKRKKA